MGETAELRTKLQEKLGENLCKNLGKNLNKIPREKRKKPATRGAGFLVTA